MTELASSDNKIPNIQYETCANTDADDTLNDSTCDEENSATRVPKRSNSCTSTSSQQRVAEWMQHNDNLSEDVSLPTFDPGPPPVFPKPQVINIFYQYLMEQFVYSERRLSQQRLAYFRNSWDFHYIYINFNIDPLFKLPPKDLNYLAMSVLGESN
jgi:hypothetical protein